jgi:putative membrane protein
MFPAAKQSNPYFQISSPTALPSVKFVLIWTVNMQNTAINKPGTFFVFVHRLSIFLLAAAFILTLTQLFVPIDSNWPEALLILLSTATTLIALARHLPPQNVLLAAFGIAFIGSGLFILDARMGIPFGPFLLDPSAGTVLFKILPWPVPFLWVIIVLNSRGVARLILRPWRKIHAYGYWLMGFTAILAVLFDLAFDPYAWLIRHYWIWTPTKLFITWQGAPLTNFLGWGVVTILILAFVTPALINKQLSKRRAPDLHPLTVWLGGIVLFGTAAATHGLWMAALADAIIFFVTAFFAVRGARW